MLLVSCQGSASSRSAAQARLRLPQNRPEARSSRILAAGAQDRPDKRTSAREPRQCTAILLSIPRMRPARLTNVAFQPPARSRAVLIVATEPNGASCQSGPSSKFQWCVRPLVIAAGTARGITKRVTSAVAWPNRRKTGMVSSTGRLAGMVVGVMTQSRSTNLFISSSCCSMDSTSLNCVRQRSRLWPSRCTLK